MLKKNLEVLALLVAFVGPAYADGGDGGQLMPVSYEAEAAAEETLDRVGYFDAGGLTCREARETAWFEREVQRSDGDVDPDAAYGPCPRAILAESSADFD